MHLFMYYIVIMSRNKQQLTNSHHVSSAWQQTKSQNDQLLTDNNKQM